MTLTLTSFQELQPDLGVVVAYGRLLKEDLLNFLHWDTL
jgi:methionyl-tRNA formyltransferase